MRHLMGDGVHPVGLRATGWVVGEGRGEYDAIPRAAVADPLQGVEQALQGLATINSWLDARSGRDVAGEAARVAVVQAVLVGLGHVDAAALAALSGTIVIAEEQGCGRRDGHACNASWVAQQLRMSGPAASRACRLAADLDDLPSATADLRAGRISRDHAVTLTSALRQQQRDQDAAAAAQRKAEMAAARQRQDEHSQTQRRHGARRVGRYRAGLCGRREKCWHHLIEVAVAARLARDGCALDHQGSLFSCNNVGRDHHLGVDVADIVNHRSAADGLASRLRLGVATRAVEAAGELHRGTGLPASARHNDGRARRHRIGSESATTLATVVGALTRRGPAMAWVALIAAVSVPVAVAVLLVALPLASSLHV